MRTPEEKVRDLIAHIEAAKEEILQSDFWRQAANPNRRLFKLLKGQLSAVLLATQGGTEANAAVRRRCPRGSRR